ncbi:histone deacetylase [Sporothrix epigloea]|uniref:Histone deacetylase n=1 Tax=Sporothrix epigloea TaxID=1892477 RepID=A0ABP0E2R7_9PEZI
MSSAHATPRRRQSTNLRDTAESHGHDDALARSLRQLSLGTGTPSKSKSPSPLSRTSTAASTGSPRSPSVASVQRNSTTPRISLAGGSSSSSNGRDSRAGTPGLLRKASMNSLHGGSSVGSGDLGSTGSPRRSLARRTSAGALKSSSPSTPHRSPLPSGGHGFEPLHEERHRPQRPPPPTAADVARSHFERELARHADKDEMNRTPLVVVLHDACYGHRFSRPRTSRANLATIVERPERIQACAVGVSAAYVRLGGRHVGGAYMPHPELEPAAFPAVAMPFRIHQTARALPLQSPTVTNVHGTKWMEELRVMCDTAAAKLALNGRELQRPDMDRGPPAHHATPARLHEGDLYLCDESLQALEGALGGVCEAVDAVFDASSSNRRAFVAIRPPGHHCSADWPSGFCWINNVHVGIMHAILAHGLTHAAIVDIDLHHGDGSQAIAWQHNARSSAAAKNAAAWKKTSIGYFSLHDINSFPCESGDEDKVKNASLCIENAHGQTVWNVHLEPWKSETAFWALYADKYAVLLDKLRAFFRNQTAQRGPAGSSGAIFISAGFDASEWETSSMQRHEVNVPTEFYARFTRDVVQIANSECAGRVVSVLEGGYSDRALYSGVLSHISGLAGAHPVTTRSEAFHSGLGYEMGSRMGKLDICGDVEENEKTNDAPYDPAWWTSAELDRIEAALAPAPPPPEVKAERAPHPATTYFSPTASSQAKVNYAPKLRRSMSSLSATYGHSAGPSSPSSRPASPPPPPPPDVPWTVAMHELSKLLIPTERTTTSCTMEDLAVHATRVRPERQTLMGGIDASHVVTASVPSTPGGPTRVSMRERKPVRPFGALVAAASTATKEEDADQHLLDRKNRRKTDGGSVRPAASVTSTPAAARTSRSRQASRRLSGASTTTPTDDFDLLPRIPPMSAVVAEGAAASTGPPTRPASAHSSTTAVRLGASMNGPGAVSKPAAAPLLATGAAGAATKTPRKKAATSTTTVSTSAKSPFSRKTNGGSSGSAAAAVSAMAPSKDDLDKLTSGLRKIKINVVTTAQKEAREKARRDAEKTKPTPVVISTTTQRQSALSSPDTELPTPAADSVAPGLSHGSSAAWAAVSADASASSSPQPSKTAQPLPPATPLSQTISAASPPLPLLSIEAVEASRMPAALTTSSDDHLPLTPSTESGCGFVVAGIAGESAVSTPTDSLSATSPTASQQPTATPSSLHWLPSTENKPSPAPPADQTPVPVPSPMKRADLPVFTSTSTIPFFAPGSSSRPSSSGASAGQPLTSLAAVPSRPATSSGPGLALSSSTTRSRSPAKALRSPTKLPRKLEQS